MVSREARRRSIIVLLSVTIFACHGRGSRKLEAVGSQQEAVRALTRYIQLRLRDADWKEYSRLITWPDEPSWDCKWVARKYKLGAPVRAGHEVIIPVAYSRLGLYCYDFYFKPEPKLVMIKYHLVKRSGGWKVNAPIPDYPDIGSDVLIKSLNATAENANETEGRRAAASRTVREIREALKSAITTLPKPKGE